MAYRIFEDGDDDCRVSIAHLNREVCSFNMNQISPTSRDWLAKFLDEKFRIELTNAFNSGYRAAQIDIKRVIGLEKQ